MLLSAIDALDDAPPWIRVHYLFPGRISDKLLEVLSRASRIVPYIDLPLQHASAPVLKRMRRPGNPDSYRRQLDALRKALPGAGVRSAFIVGFPGETDGDFRELCEFVEQQRFDTTGVFTYSHEESTPAFELEDDVPAEVKEERRAHLEALCLDISHARGEQRIGESVELLIEGPAEDDPTASSARWAGQAPEVDGRVLIPGRTDLEAGRLARGTIIDAAPFELTARIEEPAG